MRVVAKESFKTYYQMVCIDVAEGEEFDGDFADFLVTGGCAVEPAAAAEESDPQDPTTGPPPVDPPTPDEEPDEEPNEELDINGTAATVLEWVGDDPERAAEAHAAESAKDKPRSTLLKKLDEITGS